MIKNKIGLVFALGVLAVFAATTIVVSHVAVDPNAGVLFANGVTVDPAGGDGTMKATVTQVSTPDPLGATPAEVSTPDPIGA